VQGRMEGDTEAIVLGPSQRWMYDRRLITARSAGSQIGMLLEAIVASPSWCSLGCNSEDAG